MTDRQNIQQQVTDLFDRALQAAQNEGENATIIPFLALHRSSPDSALITNTLTSSLCYVANGMMRLHFSTGIVTYTSGQFFIPTVDSPIYALALPVSQTSPFIALTIRFSTEDIISVMTEAQIDYDSWDGSVLQNIEPNKASPEMLDNFRRILKLNLQAESSMFMANHLKRELVYYLVSGEYGKEFSQNFLKLERANVVGNAINWLKDHFREPLTVEKLAKMSRMSISGFHQKFKAATDMGPLQCQKKLRLLEARRLMLDEGCNTTTAALKVGYESISQFNRDYRRLFNLPPLKDIRQIRDSISRKVARPYQKIRRQQHGG